MQQSKPSERNVGANGLSIFGLVLDGVDLLALNSERYGFGSPPPGSAALMTLPAAFRMRHSTPAIAIRTPDLAIVSLEFADSPR